MADKFVENKMSFEKFNLKGKRGLITGAAGLLGKEHAAALLECSASVVLTDTSMSNLEVAKSELLKIYPDAEIDLFIMDVSIESGINDVKNSLCDSRKEVNILINNAAIDPKVNKDSLVEISRLENLKREDWDFQIAVGLTGAVLCSKIFGSLMAKSSRGGVILNIASDLSVFAPDQRLYRKDALCDALQPVKPVTYSVIKHGLIGLTKYIATYWPDKVRCNALSPGGVFNYQNDQFVERITNLIPIGRMARKDEYKSAVQFLCSDASSYMTGQNILMDGGRSSW
jgi:NAD(P)-dependent dehydrogenase (short-subunit alcohol dehydrogenase family)